MAATSASRAQPPPDVQPVPPLGSLVILLRFCTVMAVVLAAASLPASALFPVREIVVLGAAQTPRADIVARSGLRRGDRLFAVSIARVAARVATIPRIARARVVLHPSGRVIIRVQERSPYAAVPFRGAYLIVARDGVLIDRRSAPGRLPVAVSDGSAPPWVRLGDTVPDRGVRTALDALDNLPPAVIVPGITVRALVTGDLVLITPDRITVRLGPLRGLRERAEMLGALLQAVRDRGLAVEYLDLRFAGNVVMKPVGAAAAGERP